MVFMSVYNSIFYLVSVDKDDVFKAVGWRNDTKS